MPTTSGRQAITVMAQVSHYGRHSYPKLRNATVADWDRAAELHAHFDCPVTVVTSIGAVFDGVLFGVTPLGAWVNADGEGVHVPLGEVIDITPTGPRIERAPVDEDDEQDGDDRG